MEASCVEMPHGFCVVLYSEVTGQVPLCFVSFAVIYTTHYDNPVILAEKQNSLPCVFK